jgi:hypothetical protein
MTRIQQALIFVFVLVTGCATQIEPIQRTDQGAVQARQAGVQTSLADGPGITALINKNYNEDTTSCREYGSGAVRGYYFCTGVLIRTTDDGDFNPWDSSSVSARLQATSYSWFRHDLNTTGFYKPAGFILLSPADSLAGAVPGITYPTHTGISNTMVKCVYPFDAWTTRVMSRNYFGCNLEGSGLGSPDVYNSWGSCDNRLGLKTSEQWNAHFRSVKEVHYQQCSWNADTEYGWSNMIASHNAFAGQSAWNEVMLHNGGPTAAGVQRLNEATRKWIVAFFYDAAKTSGLQIVQSFQRKMAATGKRVPIVRLSFTAPAAQRFQFQQADQVAGLYP